MPLLALLGPPLGSHAQEPGLGLVLRMAPRLSEQLSDAEAREGASHTTADSITALPDERLRLQGQAVVRKPGMVLRADTIDYDLAQDVLQAQGQVRLNQKGNRISAPKAWLQVDRFQGEFETPQFQLLGGGHGQARRLRFEDPERMSAQQAQYTTCRAQPGPGWLPEWLIKATRLQTDSVEGMATAENAQLQFLGVDLPPIPRMRFPLEGTRMSGFLSPLLSLDTIAGVDVVLPYYWNVAPNRDVTVVPRLMSKRGAAVEAETRYLENDYRGQWRLNWMPTDDLRHAERWGVIGQHQGTVQTGWPEIGTLSTSFAVARVSDGDYWRDFPRSYLGGLPVPGAAALNQRALPTTAVVSWGQGAWSMVAQAQSWQTQQNVTSPITPPYDRVPQLTLRYAPGFNQGLEWSMVADTTRFEADYSRIPNVSASTLAALRNGQRSYSQVQLSRPWVAPWGFITPKVQLHATRYDLDTALAQGRSFDRVLPTFSLDSGLVFERPASWWGRDLTQTLEPRAFWVRTPYKNQDMLPVYDSGPTDFNLSTIYFDSPYVGQDRIVDNDTLTLGVNTRLFDNVSGTELLRLGVAQRIRFSDQRVALNPSLIEEKGLSDILMGASTRWSPAVSTDAAVQINNQTQQVRRSTVQGRYNPSPYRLVNVAYRYNRVPLSTLYGNTATELVDVGWQWPLSDLRWGARPDDSGVRYGGQGLGANRWYSVGRMNYSAQDGRLVDALVGFEYDAGCWIGRVVLERLNSTVVSSNTRIMFQLDLIGFGRGGVGTNPLTSLRQNIHRYQFLRETPNSPTRFLHYE